MSQPQNQSSQGYQRNTTTGGVPYFKHYVGNFIKPYGEAFCSSPDVYYIDHVWPSTCEWINRPDVQISEVAQSFNDNVEAFKKRLSYLAEASDAYMPLMREFSEMISDLNSKSDRKLTDKDEIRERVYDMKDFIDVEKDFNTFMDLVYKLGSICVQLGIHYRFAHIFLSDRLMDQKRNKMLQKTETKRFRENPTLENYIEIIAEGLAKYNQPSLGTTQDNERLPIPGRTPDKDRHRLKTPQSDRKRRSVSKTPKSPSNESFFSPPPKSSRQPSSAQKRSRSPTLSTTRRDITSALDAPGPSGVRSRRRYNPGFGITDVKTASRRSRRQPSQEIQSTNPLLYSDVSNSRSSSDDESSAIETAYETKKSTKKHVIISDSESEDKGLSSLISVERSQSLDRKRAKQQARERQDQLPDSIEESQLQCGQGSPKKKKKKSKSSQRAEEELEVIPETPMPTEEHAPKKKKKDRKDRQPDEPEQITQDETETEKKKKKKKKHKKARSGSDSD